MLERLIRYYQRNQHRMYYGFYREKKLFIGSGRHPVGQLNRLIGKSFNKGPSVLAKDGLNLEPSRLRNFG